MHGFDLWVSAAPSLFYLPALGSADSWNVVLLTSAAAVPARGLCPQPAARGSNELDSMTVSDGES